MDLDHWIDDVLNSQAEDTTNDGRPLAKALECPYCGPFQLCQAPTTSECWSETDDAES